MVSLSSPPRPTTTQFHEFFCHFSLRVFHHKLLKFPSHYCLSTSKLYLQQFVRSSSLCVLYACYHQPMFLIPNGLLSSLLNTFAVFTNTRVNFSFIFTHIVRCSSLLSYEKPCHCHTQLLFTASSLFPSTFFANCICCARNLKTINSSPSKSVGSRTISSAFCNAHLHAISGQNRSYSLLPITPIFSFLVIKTVAITAFSLTS